MAVALDIIAVDKGQKNFTKTATVTFSGNYVTGGATLDLTAVTSLARIEAAQFHRNPLFARVNKGAIAGYVMEIIKGTLLTNWLIKIYESGADGGDLDEIAQAAYPAAILAADVDLTLDFVETAS